MDTPEPKPTLLSTLGVSGGVVPPAAPTPTETGEAPPSTRPRRAPRRPKSSVAAQIAAEANGSTEQLKTLQDALSQIQQRHRERRSTGLRTPLAPLNVDIPLDLLEHVREVSQDIPYPLRRLAEEAIELWLEATGQRPPADLSSSDAPRTIGHKSRDGSMGAGS